MTLVTLVLLEMMFLISRAHTEIVAVQDPPTTPSAMAWHLLSRSAIRWSIRGRWGPSMRGSTSGTPVAMVSSPTTS